MSAHFRAALLLVAAGLVAAVVALPLPSLTISDPLLDGGTEGFNRDDRVMAVVIAVIAAVVLLAAVLRKPVLLSWALLPVAVFTAWAVLIGVDIEFDTAFLASELVARLNESRSLAAGSWLTGVGLLLVTAGLAVPLLERWRVRTIR
ncbi:hypothetical protein [Virgisporangium aurantiacum]|uniref:Uncharacterized protein n=1 Tax=Virgisporangium aurantiacum TaxID=175570 RepID=A0A8J3Z512_9ACTN|nr:hypothetical protein [Virgisporangium aurantiacum]GIJ56557.1 hypothetical protein Vau01_040730 [Virgisporangium aurantiacum]